jgi:hypothetical protein
MLDLSLLQKLPTRESPMLMGLLIDVSASMITSIRNASGTRKGRIESFGDALNDFVNQGKALCQEEASKQIIPLFSVFAYGFGFGNPVATLFGGGKPYVRDLFDISGSPSSTIAIDQLFENWNAYQSHVMGMITQMFGSTPMLEAFEKVKERFIMERAKRSYTDPPILFVLSDGEPSDGKPDDVLKVAESLKASGIFIISCYVTDKDISNPKKLYGTPQADWPEGAKLMFECASVVPALSSFNVHLHKYGWEVENNTHLFAQVNQSEILKQFLEVTLSPLQLQENLPEITPKLLIAGTKPEQKQIRVFVSYSHQDRKYLDNDSLLGYLKGLEQEGFEFWNDQRIRTSEIWDTEVRNQINSADIALVLVSQAFLNSKYCHDVEITTFIEERKQRGLRIFPIILSACDWKRYNWLSSTQFQPLEGKNIESDFRDRGKRSELFLKILEDFRGIGENIR